MGTRAGAGWLDLETGRVSDEIELRVRAVAASADGRTVAMATDDGFRIASASDLSRHVSLERRHVSGVAFSPDGSLVALATWEHGAVWRVATLLGAA